MKKVYTFAILLLTLWVSSTQAQCPPGPNVAVPYILPGNDCRVVVINMHPNSIIRVLNAAGTDITIPNPGGLQPTTDAGGEGAAFYNCNSTPAYVVTFGSGQTCFALVTAPINLPIKVKNFTAQAQGDNSVLLAWISVFEANSFKYVVQKSADGRNFSDIGELDAAGNSLGTIKYSFSDKQGTDGSAFYRLKLVDLDGSIDYTKIIYINNNKSGSGSLSVFPNPFRSEVQLKGINFSEVNRTNVRVYDVLGKDVDYRIVGGNAISIDPSLPKGVYILRVKQQTYKLFKE